MGQSKFEGYVIDEARQWSTEKIYDVFGSFLEKVVEDKKEKYRLILKTVWKNRVGYAFRDTGERFDSDTMLYYFNPKKIRKYSLIDMEDIIVRIECEAVLLD